MIKLDPDFVWWEKYPEFCKQMLDVVTRTNHHIIKYDEFKQLVHSDQNLQYILEEHLDTTFSKEIPFTQRTIIKNLLEEPKIHSQPIVEDEK